MTETRIHPETGQELRRDVRPRTISFGSLARTLNVPGWYPSDDGDSIHSGEDLEASDEAYIALRTAYAEHVKSVRKKLKLTQEEAGWLIGGGKRAFQKYEKGVTPPSNAAVALLEVLGRHPEEVQMLRDLRAQTTEPAIRIFDSNLEKRLPRNAQS